ncbi:hypothetical protein ig2599ANME_0485 [groundwater metagenome]
MRIYPKTKKILGFTILNFEKRSEHMTGAETLPILLLLLRLRERQHMNEIEAFGEHKAHAMPLQAFSLFQQF